VASGLGREEVNIVAYLLSSGYATVGDEPKSDSILDFGTTTLSTTRLFLYIGIPTVIAVYFGSKLRKAGMKLLPTKG
jgi:hypothetical protein